jgi:hypothetical protein
MCNEIEPCTREEVIAASADIPDMVAKINKEVDEYMDTLELILNA